MKDKSPYIGIDPPKGFQNFDPYGEVNLYHRHLPHWRQDGATYAVTFRQTDSLPQAKTEEIKDLRTEWESKHPEPRSEKDWEEYAREFTRRIDGWLDEGYGSCHFSTPENVDILADALTKFHNKRYHTGAYVIMPNHCHLLIRPFEGEDLEKLLKGIKGSVARDIHKQLGKTGEYLWEQESYDRIVRDPQHLSHALQYIGENPQKAGLTQENSWRCWVADDWAEQGWHFDMFNESD